MWSLTAWEPGLNLTQAMVGVLPAAHEDSHTRMAFCGVTKLCGAHCSVSSSGWKRLAKENHRPGTQSPLPWQPPVWKQRNIHPSAAPNPMPWHCWCVVPAIWGKHLRTCMGNQSGLQGRSWWLQHSWVCQPVQVTTSQSPLSQQRLHAQVAASQMCPQNENPDNCNLNNLVWSWEQTWSFLLYRYMPKSWYRSRLLNEILSPASSVVCQDSRKGE